MGNSSRLDLRIKLEGLGLKTTRLGLAGCGKDPGGGDPNARPRPPGVWAPACTGPAGGARGAACEVRSPSRKLSRISKQPRLQLGPGEKPGLEHPCPPAAPASYPGLGSSIAGRHGAGEPGEGWNWIFFFFLIRGLALKSVAGFGGRTRGGDSPGEGDPAWEELCSP